jgi:hypothetical protein
MLAAWAFVAFALNYQPGYGLIGAAVVYGLCYLASTRKGE